MEQLLHTIFELDRKLLYLKKYDYEVLLTSDFMEIDPIGRSLSKTDLLKKLDKHNGYSTIPFILSKFKMNQLAPTVVQTIFHTTKIDTGEQLIRTSIWQLGKNDWMLKFHQKTKIK